jgi:hypothetical protein
MTQSTWIGQTLSGRYKIEELLGQGGMSAVYKASDPNLRRVVAVKIIHPHLSSDPEFVRRFEEEAAAVAQLRHPNLIQVYDFNHDEDTYYIVFEFVPGESVQARLKRMKTAERPMDIQEAVEIAAQAADGLQYAHTKGLIHRDIKPANIMLNVTGDPIIMDFGIAKIMGGTQHTATGAVLGTARYMSPEQIKGERIDPRTDIYSLGVTFFEMLGGRPPFTADSAMTLMMMHMTDPVPNLQDLRADVPASLVAVVNKSLAKESSDRYQTAAEFAVALRNSGKDAAAPIVAATVLESTVPKAEVFGTLPADPDQTVLEPVTAEIVDDSPPSSLDTGATAAAVAAAAVTAGTTAPGTAAPPPPSTGAPATTATPPPKSGGSRTPLYAVGGVILLLLIAVGVWAIFFRGSGEDEIAGGGEVPTVTVIPTGTPDAQATIDAGVSAELETRAAGATQTAEALPTDTPQVEPTHVPPAESVGSVEEVDGQVLMITAGGEEILVTEDTPIIEGSQFITSGDGQLTFLLEDESIVQLLENSGFSLDGIADDPGGVYRQTNFTLTQGNVLLRQPEAGNELVVYSQAGSLISTLQNAAASSNAPKAEVFGTLRAVAAKRAQQADMDEAAMSIHLEDEVRVVVSCFSGVCTTGGGSLLPPGWEKVVTANGDFISSFPITSASASYQLWQAACEECLVEAPDPIEATATLAATQIATEEPVTPTLAPTVTTEATPTEVATEAVTATPTAAAAAYAARINSIALENGTYIVGYETSGYTEQVPGQHVHFYFDTVSEANAGVPGSGPWKLYGGPRPFTQYTEADRGNASSLCISVANPDHSIISGSGNCYPLP